MRPPRDHHAIGAVSSWRPPGHNGHREQDAQRGQNPQNPPELLHRTAPALRAVCPTGWARSATVGPACRFVMIPPALFRGPTAEIGCGVARPKPANRLAVVRHRKGGGEGARPALRQRVPSPKLKRDGDGWIDRSAWLPAVSRCTYCGDETPGRRALCSRHGSSYNDDWATGNRIMCDFVHRGIVSGAPPKPRGSEVEVSRGTLEVALGEL
jgi:hypothetical protein